MRKTIYTIGHSNREFRDFVRLLSSHSVDYLVDVRYIPYSKYVTQFNKETIAPALREYDITYIFLGYFLGIDYTNENVRSSDGSYTDYERIAQTESFATGLRQVMEGVSEGYRMALMCSEKDPIECHRAILISRRLAEKGYEVLHLTDIDSEPEAHSELEERLLALHNKQKNPDQFDLFAPSVTLEEAYVLQNIAMSHKVKREKA